MIGFEDLPSWFAGLKDVTGWAVVVWIVWWLTKRWEAKSDEMTRSISLLAKSCAELAAASGAHSKTVETTYETVRALVADVSEIAGMGAETRRALERVEAVCAEIKAGVYGSHPRG